MHKNNATLKKLEVKGVQAAYRALTEADWGIEIINKSVRFFIAALIATATSSPTWAS